MPSLGKNNYLFLHHSCPTVPCPTIIINYYLGQKMRNHQQLMAPFYLSYFTILAAKRPFSIYPFISIHDLL